ncbi:hypothetical protein KR222_009968 [Zaprionus bogoriensis]|nr:hypothetical protein KR222_009968 [Zaprionus bogoriensis]
MIYFIVKFIKLCLSQPTHIARHLRLLRQEWQEHVAAQHVAGGLFVSYEFFQNCYVTHQVASADCADAYCFHKQIACIIGHLNRAQHTIDLAMFALSVPAIEEALRRAAKRGVRVRVICEILENLKSETFDEIPIRKAIKPTYQTLMHHKFCIIDGYRAQRSTRSDKTAPLIAVAFSGSMNWVSPPNSCDDVLITSMPKICNRLEQEFNRMWDNVT